MAFAYCVAKLKLFASISATDAKPRNDVAKSANAPFATSSRRLAPPDALGRFADSRTSGGFAPSLTGATPRSGRAQSRRDVSGKQAQRNYNSRKKTKNMNDWFRNKNWNNEIEAKFYNQLASKSKNTQLDFLKIQADIWLNNPSLPAQNAGLKILENILIEYSHEIFSLISIREILSEYFIKNGEFKIAETHLIPIVDFYQKNKRIGIIRKADLQLAELILLTNQTDRFKEALELIENYEKTGGNLSEQTDKFYYYELVAQLKNKTGNKAEAKKFALKAMEIYAELENGEMIWLISKPELIESYYEKLPKLFEI